MHELWSADAGNTRRQPDPSPPSSNQATLQTDSGCGSSCSHQPAPLHRPAQVTSHPRWCACPACRAPAQRAKGSRGEAWSRSVNRLRLVPAKEDATSLAGLLNASPAALAGHHTDARQALVDLSTETHTLPQLPHVAVRMCSPAGCGGPAGRPSPGQTPHAGTRAAGACRWQQGPSCRRAPAMGGG